MFLINSLSHLVTATPDSLQREVDHHRGTPSSEVTVLICRVPSPEFSQRLSILYLTTCVGLRYGYNISEA